MAPPRTSLIRAMRLADVDPAAAMILRNDWGERRIFFDWALHQPGISPLVAEESGEVVGTGVASAHGSVGWIGTIFVDPERRGQGLGRALTRAVIDDLESRGCRTLVLIATPMGRRIYDRDGFRVLAEHLRFTIDGLPAGDGATPQPQVRPFRYEDLDPIVALDRQVTGEDRSAVLRALVSPESTTVAVGPGGEVRGFLARAPWRGGALIAPDPNDAMRLLDARRRATGPGHPAGAGIVGTNQDGRRRLLAAGWAESSGGVRMIRGEPLDWRPNGIWGQLNGALG